MSTPAINVNLAPCSCTWAAINMSARALGKAERHNNGCPGVPLCLPCPIPRSVSFSVVLGECNCANDPDDTRHAPPPERHLSSCPARSIRVTGSIGGETWAGSEVVDVDNAERHDGLFPDVDPDAVLAACRERWPLVKALVLGHQGEPGRTPSSEAFRRLRAQRDAVFSALADMAKEEEAKKALGAVIKAMPDAERWAPTSAFTADLARMLLERYVERLIKQVGVLP